MKAKDCGVFVVGVVAGVADRSWESGGKSGVDVTLGLSRSYVDQFNNEVTETIGVRLVGKEIPALRVAAEKLRGQVAMIRVTTRGYASRTPGGDVFIRYTAAPGATLDGLPAALRQAS
jgi:hypothetical protein